MAFKDKEKAKVYNKKYKELNKDRLAKYNRDYHQANKDKTREHRLEYSREYRIKNKDNIKEKNKIYYKENLEIIKKCRLKHKNQRAEYSANKYKALSLWWKEYKINFKCSHCGETDINCLDFHHTNPKEKEINVSKVTLYSKAKGLREIAKCIALCANCHRKEHAKLREEYVRAS